jgi:hypothetical protein
MCECGICRRPDQYAARQRMGQAVYERAIWTCDQHRQGHQSHCPGCPYCEGIIGIIDGLPSAVDLLAQKHPCRLRPGYTYDDQPGRAAG